MKKVTRKVGKYEVGRTIGEGTFAKVKFARNTVTGESVAMKILAKSTILKHRMVEQVCACFSFLKTHLEIRILLTYAYVSKSGILASPYWKFICFAIDVNPFQSWFFLPLVMKLDFFIGYGLQIKREISIMKIVRHPNIVRLHEVCLCFSAYKSLCGHIFYVLFFFLNHIVCLWIFFHTIFWVIGFV